MNIDEQIKALQRRKAKIELLQGVSIFIHSIAENQVYPGLVEEVQQIVDRFIEAVSAKVEGGEMSSTRAGHISSADSEQVQSLVQSALPEIPRMPVTDEDRNRRKEKAEFAKKYRHLGNKLVTVDVSGKDPIRALVVSVDAPHIFVQTPEGVRMPVTPDQITESNP